jgi:hypothetical protein
MTPDHLTLLLKLIAEYSDSLERAAAESDQQRAIAARAVTELGIPAAPFTTLAKAVYKDAVRQEREKLDRLTDLFDVMRDHDGPTPFAQRLRGLDLAERLRQAADAH